ncbi:hypothetical protein ACVWWD_002529 [Mesorhizobium sp. URHB0026]
MVGRASQDPVAQFLSLGQTSGLLQLERLP